MQCKIMVMSDVFPSSAVFPNRKPSGPLLLYMVYMAANKLLLLNMPIPYTFVFK